jgi:hypothetical protein
MYLIQLDCPIQWRLSCQPPREPSAAGMVSDPGHQTGDPTAQRRDAGTILLQPVKVGVADEPVRMGPSEHNNPYLRVAVGVFDEIDEFRGSLTHKKSQIVTHETSQDHTAAEILNIDVLSAAIFPRHRRLLIRVGGVSPG